MNKAENIFRTPFSTALSGSARETDRRIRNIFLWKKKRPPVLVLVLAAVLIALCGGLVSCQERTEPVTLVMDTQYYDTQGNYIEIPALAMSADTQPTAGVTAINQALSQLKQEYQDILDGVVDDSSLSSTENHCLLYPTETQRYWNLVFFREEFHTDLNTGHVTSLVYNKETGQQVTLEEALELAGQTVDDLCQALADQYDPTLGQDIPGADLCIQNQTVEGFRMGADGQPIFYLTARVDDRDDTASDFVSGSDNLYIWSNGTFTLYDQYAVTDLQPLVPSEECIDLNPPLWRQWNFSGGEPEGGLSSASGLQLSDSDTKLRDELILTYYQQAYPERNTYWLSDLPAAPQEGDVVLGSVTYAGEALLYETTGVAFWIQTSQFSSSQWTTPIPQPSLIVLSRGQDGSFQGVLGEPTASFSIEEMEMEDIIRQTAWNLLNIEVCLFRDGYPNPIGPGNWYDLFNSAYVGEPEIQILEGWEPIYSEGSYWERWSVEGFSALRYYAADRDTFSLNTLDVTRDDLYTPRGIRVGASREDVLTAYPEAVTGNYWDKYPDEPDMLSYIPWSFHDPSQVTDFSDLESPCFGPAILFFFNGDTLRQITLTNMLD
ncbi:hypothetical protein [Flintibacter sp. KGMB00164]|uniref:hypothetical protein n=1 Tax=Flintibacter sp. KGMB00164 TaxID=2610895 RepID=UPI0012456F90|nr:hypothetical protein [Flintibacter sp. KGMB00164]